MRWLGWERLRPIWEQNEAPWEQVGTVRLRNFSMNNKKYKVLIYFVPIVPTLHTLITRVTFPTPKRHRSSSGRRLLS